MTNNFPRQTCDFLQDLASNNERDWFSANKGRYEKMWLEPATRYVSALAGTMAKLNPPHKAEPKLNGSIRRLHRDTRFSKDKTPFDPKLHFVFWTGEHPNRSPAIHIVLHPDHVGFGAGQFVMTKDELESYRQTISADDEARIALKEILNDLFERGCILTDETLKTVPRGFSILESDECLIKRKDLVVRTSQVKLPPEFLCDSSQLAELIQYAARLNHWLVAHVKSR